MDGCALGACASSRGARDLGCAHQVNHGGNCVKRFMRCGDTQQPRSLPRWLGRSVGQPQVDGNGSRLVIDSEEGGGRHVRRGCGAAGPTRRREADDGRHIHAIELGTHGEALQCSCRNFLEYSTCTVRCRNLRYCTVRLLLPHIQGPVACTDDDPCPAGGARAQRTPRAASTGPAKPS